MEAFLHNMLLKNGFALLLVKGEIRKVESVL